MKTFSFQLEKTKGTARAGRMQTPHGEVLTPIYMPVGTQASVKALDSEDVLASEASIILANTYHLYLRPGTETLQKMGGIHQFMKWPKPMLTDSGGFQVFSLGLQGTANQVKIKDDGVEFSSYVDGSKHFFSPSRAVDIQRAIGADIAMAFDECTPDGATLKYAQEALGRTHRWAAECVEAWERSGRQTVYGDYQALFGIIQGAMIPELRRQSAEFITSLPFDGIAVGGETIGYNMKGTQEVMTWIEPTLPVDKPRYAMGLGRDPQNIIDGVKAGFDMFDCVAPTRLARNGALYVGDCRLTDDDIFFDSPYEKGRLSINKAEFTTDDRVIQPGCDCTTCQAGYTRAYLHHLSRVKELSYYRLASIHNSRFMVRLSQQVREWVLR